MIRQRYKNCERCLKPFYAYPYNFEQRRFCSTNCSNKSTGNQQSATKKAKTKAYFGKSETRKRYNSLYYQWRDLCITRDNSICQKCGKILKAGTQTIVHHIKSWRDYPELRYEVNNGVTLCRSCHNIIHVLPSRKKRSGY